MNKLTSYLSRLSLLFVCLIALMISCSDNGSSPQPVTIEISSISPDSGAVGSEVTIHSPAIDPEHANNQVELDGIDVPILSYGSGSLVFEVPEGATSGPVTLRVNGKVASGPYFKVLTGGPVIEAVSPDNGGPGTQVTITGEHFLPPSAMGKATGDSTAQGTTTSATDDSLHAEDPEVTLKAKGQPSPTINGLPVSVAFGDQLAPMLSLSNTEIIVEVPEGATGGLITLTVDGQTATSSGFSLIPPPQISEVTPTAGPAGTKITISGHHFAPQPDSNRVTFNGIPAEIMQTDSTQLVATVPNKATTGPIEVMSNGQEVTGPTFTVTDAPVPQVSISNLSTKSGPVGTEVTITGQNFSADKVENSVTFNGTEATLQSASETELITTVPQSATNGPVKVEVNGQTATGPSFSVTADPDKQLTIADMSPKEGPVGTNVTITGANFSSTASKNTVTFNGTEAAVGSASTTELTVSVPQGATTGAVKVAVGSQTAEGPTFTVTEPPVPQVTISDLSPKQGPVGTEVTITGTNFSSTPSENTVTFNGTEATVSSATETELVATVPQGATSGSVKVQVNGQTATGPSFSVTADPDKQLAIKDITPKEGPVGTSVTITGANFSGTASKNTVTFNSTEAAVGSASTTELTVTVPQGATTGAVKVAVGSQAAEGPTFSVTEEPVPRVTIDDISPKEGPVGTSVTITGANFSSTAAENSVTFNGTQATVQSASESELVATVPQSATDGPVKVTVGDQSATGPSFSVTADPDKQLAIEDISPKEGPIGTSVTITGANFSGTASENSVTFNGTQATITSASTTELVASVPQGATTGVVKVAVGSQTAEGPTYTVTEEPVPQVTIEDISPKEGPVGTSVTITGINFSAAASENTVTFNGTEATVSSASTTELVATVPDGTTSGPVKVSVGAQTATGPNFTITANAAPTITGEGSFEIEENTTAVATITASDPDGDDLTFALSGGADQGQFSIGEASGELAFTSAPDFENPADSDADNSYEFEVKVSDGALDVTKTITVTVADVNEAPAITSGASFSIEENSTDVGTITASDPEGAALTYSLAGGTDESQFSIDASSGALTFNTAPDLENPADANGNNSYELEVKVSDGALSATQAVTVTVQNVNEAPVITSPASFDVDENTTAVTTITADDPDGDDLTFSLAGGADQGQFSIDGSSGELIFSLTPDYEAPPGFGDSDNNQVYEVTVQVSDGAQSATQDITVDLQNVAEAPAFFRGKITANDGETYYAYEPGFTFAAVPAGTDLSSVLHFYVTMLDNVDPITSASISGPDADAFSVTSTNDYYINLSGPTLQYSESPYEFSITAENAAGQTTTQTFTLPVQPFAGGSGTAADPFHVENVEQLQAVGQYLDAHFVQTVDIDASATAGWNGGKGFDRIGGGFGGFSGSYDGGGHTISGLTIDRPNTDDIGLFSMVYGGVIKNVHLRNVDITGQNDVGGLAGTISPSGTTTSSSVTGAVTGNNDVGGLAGINQNGGTITESYAHATVSGNRYVGGLVGYNTPHGSFVTDSYATGSVTGNDDVGGLVGLNAGDIVTSYATGAVSGGGVTGGLVGINIFGSTTQSYWDTQSTGQATSDGGTGLTTSQMQGTAAQTNMTGFDFSSVWKTNTGDYPTLISNPEE